MLRHVELLGTSGLKPLWYKCLKGSHSGQSASLNVSNINARYSIWLCCGGCIWLWGSTLFCILCIQVLYKELWFISFWIIMTLIFFIFYASISNCWFLGLVFAPLFLLPFLFHCRIVFFFFLNLMALLIPWGVGFSNWSIIPPYTSI